MKSLNDALAWGIFPLYFASHGLSLGRIATLTAIYPMVWGILQLGTGWASDIVGRKRLIVLAMDVVTFVHEGLGNSSYLVQVGDGEAILVDPDL